jgi:hypothetical protein
MQAQYTSAIIGAEEQNGEGYKKCVSEQLVYSADLCGRKYHA